MGASLQSRASTTTLRASTSETRVLAACARETSRIGLGTAITSVFVRTAPTIAMAAATVDDLSGGRFILGIGSSHKVQVEAEHGVLYAKPLTRTRETVEVVRALLRDGRVEYRGETIRIDGFDLWFAPRRREPSSWLWLHRRWKAR